MQKHAVQKYFSGPAAYFGHFCALLHLEYLEELEDMRRRFLTRTLEHLQKLGWAVGPLIEP